MFVKNINHIKDTALSNYFTNHYCYTCSFNTVDICNRHAVKKLFQIEF